MRKLLISVLIIILLVITIYMCYSGITLINLRVLGIKQIQNLNDELDNQISIASRLISTDYPTEVSNVSKSVKELKTQKENYESLITISTDEQVQVATKFEKYEIETLWVMIGNHAKDEGINMKMDISNSSVGAVGLYDLNFTVKGQYVGIADFIHDIENDSKLGFKIENFKLLPDENTNTLIGTFTCKDISINIDPSNIAYSIPNPEDESIDDNVITNNDINVN